MVFIDGSELLHKLALALAALSASLLSLSLPLSQGGAGGAPPTGLWGARLVGEAGLRAPAAGLHAGAA